MNAVSVEIQINLRGLRQPKDKVPLLQGYGTIRNILMLGVQPKLRHLVHKITLHPENLPGVGRDPRTTLEAHTLVFVSEPVASQPRWHTGSLLEMDLPSELTIYMRLAFASEIEIARVVRMKNKHERHGAERRYVFGKDIEGIAAVAEF